MDQDNHRILLEQTLEKAAAQMQLCCRLAPADWDFDENLRTALQEKSCIGKIKVITKQYDQTIDLINSSNLQIDKKYFYLYKLDT